jgi:hypothetical protein
MPDFSKDRLASVMSTAATSSRNFTFQLSQVTVSRFGPGSAFGMRKFPPIQAGLSFLSQRIV